MTVMKTGPRDEDFEQRLVDAVQAYAALGPVDKALHDAEQRRSFVRGQIGRDPGPDVLAAEVVRLLALLAEAVVVLERCEGRAPSDQFLAFAFDDSLVASVAFTAAQLRAVRSLVARLREEAK